ncbi:hypothetical protein EA187_10305 [Lujinxingia sediminis]|uniref:Zinc ribbon domain-containing protein n=1 Tax=Lujinxingia sediminis TaxID=2480984 RepID=A0ABY0CTQ1_9DELT|nr:hypothetical protein [Lujinxingia sediminis]RVU44920.1 hypothetical protein EA187_10305 [Lujinxingia sediminis]
MKICPSCNARVQPQASTCPGCGEAFEERAPRQTMMGIPAIFDEESEAAVHQGRTAAAPRSTLFGLPAITGADLDNSGEHEARTAMVSVHDLPFEHAAQGSEEDDSTRQVDAAKLRQAFEAQEVDVRATAFGMPSPLTPDALQREPRPTPMARSQSSDEDQVISAWGLSEESSEELATQVLSVTDFANPDAGGGSMSVDKSEGARSDGGRLHTLMGMSLEEESDLMSGGGAMRVGGVQSDADDAPTQAMSMAQLQAGAEKLTRGASLRDRLKKSMQKAERTPLPTPDDLRVDDLHTDVMPGQSRQPAPGEAGENPFKRSHNRDTPRSGVYKVARRGREAGGEGVGMVEDSGVLGTTGTYQVGPAGSEPRREQPFGGESRPRTAFPTSSAGAASTPSAQGLMQPDADTDVGAPSLAQAAGPNPWQRSSTGPRFGITLPEPGGAAAESTIDDVPELEVEALDPVAPEPRMVSREEPMQQGPQRTAASFAEVTPVPGYPLPAGDANFGATPAPGYLSPAGDASFGAMPAPGAPVAQPFGGAFPGSEVPTHTHQPGAPQAVHQHGPAAPSAAPTPAAKTAHEGAEALVGTLQKVCGLMAGIALVAASALGVAGGGALTALTVVPVVMGVLAILLPFLPISRGIASAGFGLVALGTLGAVVASALGGNMALALFVHFGGGLLAGFAAAFPLVLKLVKPS